MSGGETVTLTRVLHPCVLVRCGRTQVLIDPCFGLFARRPLTSRVMGIELPDPGVAPEAMAGLSLIALTHGHEDHFDAAGLARLPTRAARVIAPTASLARRLRRLGFAEAEVLGTWQTAHGEGWTLTAVPARAPNAPLEVSYVLEVGGVRLLHAGDTAMHGRFEEIRERCAPVAGCLPVSGVTLLGVRLTMTPEQAARAAAILRLKAAVPIHAEMRFRRASRLLYRARGTAEAFARAARRLCPDTRVLLADRGAPVTLGPFP